MAYFWGVSDGQLYPQLRVLAEKGFIAPVDGADAGAHAKQEWRLTDAGRAALHEWLEEPSPPVATRDESLVKLLFAAREDPALALKLVRRRRQQFLEFQAIVADTVPAATWTDEERRTANPTPALIREYGLDYAATAIAWCDRAEQTLSSTQKIAVPTEGDE